MGGHAVARLHFKGGIKLEMDPLIQSEGYCKRFVCPLVYSGQKGSDSTFVAAIFRIEALGWCGMVGHAVAMATFPRVVSKKIGSADSARRYCKLCVSAGLQWSERK